MTSRSRQNSVTVRVFSTLPVKRLSNAIVSPTHSRVVTTAPVRLIRNEKNKRRGQGTRRTNRYTRNATIAPALKALQPDWISPGAHSPQTERGGTSCSNA